MNIWPENATRVHLMGICGTGMAALAGMLQERGLTVSGSDENVYPPMSDFLAGRGIRVKTGYGPHNLDPLPDVVVVGNVIQAKNPEAVALMDRGLPYVSLPQALGELFLATKDSIVLAGTHGKTTTAALTAWILHAAGRDPSFLVGGIIQGFQSNFGLGQGRQFVIEGDEYDTAFFDKGPKFLHYRPRLAVIGSIEFDHADIFPSYRDVRRAFSGLVGLMPADGWLLVCGDDRAVLDVAREARCPVRTYGLSEGVEVRAASIEPQPGGTAFSLIMGGKEAGRGFLSMWGDYNVVNALAAVGAATWCGLEPGEALAHLATFPGVKRRQEIVGAARGVSVVDDFAHHPTAVRETIAGIKDFGPRGRLIAVFEPRSNTSIRRVFQRAYAEAFDKADEAIISRPQNYKGLAEAERLDPDALARDVAAAGVPARCLDGASEIIDYLTGRVHSGDIVLIMSNGGFDDIHGRLLTALAA
ncbi:MAG: UDP-N-acetylmuramate:L-alanyl-gamma-D-glutamyl-meso-diaminopimelate ligase [Proteobacteria bacterium]|nr:UDP-N-acetylmuramate:L-alanyl-gamma-D-glutamyl-meso-diaminopimelate ligase [Pseudomonadota bacterium]